MIVIAVHISFISNGMQMKCLTALLQNARKSDLFFVGFQPLLVGCLRFPLCSYYLYTQSDEP